jgi:hypothetical protein
MMAAVRTFETSAYSNETTWRYIPEGSNFYSRRREYLKSHKKPVDSKFQIIDSD